VSFYRKIQFNFNIANRQIDKFSRDKLFELAILKTDSQYKLL